MPNPEKPALVVSGGGAKGAFAAGVIQSIFERYRKDGWFRVVGGTSTGALLSPLVALMGGPLAEEARKLMLHVYTSVGTGDILRWNLPFGFLRKPDCIWRSDPLRTLIETRFTQEWFEWLREPDTPLCYVTYVDFGSGRTHHVSPKDPGVDRVTFMKALLASTSEPVFMNPVWIGKHLAYDGGVRDLLPFKRAIESGADLIVPVFLGPKDIKKATGRFRCVWSIFFRLLEIMLNETGVNDAREAERVNSGVLLREELRQAFKEDPDAREILEKVLSNPRYANLLGPDKRLVRIVEGVRPDKSLTDFGLTFKKEAMQMWMKAGRKKADEVVTTSPFM